MHDERPPLAARPEVILDETIGRLGAGAPFERHREHARRLVEDDERSVFEEEVEAARTEGPWLPRRAARPIHPDGDYVAFTQSPRSIVPAGLGVADEDLAPLERGRDTAARPESIGGGEKLVEPRARVGGGDDPGGARGSQLSIPYTPRYLPSRYRRYGSGSMRDPVTCWTSSWGSYLRPNRWTCVRSQARSAEKSPPRMRSSRSGLSRWIFSHSCAEIRLPSV